MGYVDRFIKNINLENKKHKTRGTLLANLMPGDIIWARRYSEEEVRKNIELEHQESPFVVIYKNELDIVYCLDCSSKANTKVPNIIMFNKKNYPNIFFRNTYVKLRPDIEMTSYRYIRKLGSLLPEDFNLLKKRLFLLMTDENIEKMYSFSKNKLTYYMDTGDIVRFYGNFYLVGYKAKKHYIAYKAIPDKNSKEIVINEEPYKILYDSRVKIKFTDICVLYGFYHKYKPYLNRKKYTGYHIATIGDLLQLENSLYLVHGKYKKYLVVIKIYENQKDIKLEKYKSIYINNKMYLSGFEFFLLPQEHEYNIISQILEFEICEYLCKMKELNITPTVDKENIIKTTTSKDINISNLQKEIVFQLEQMSFALEEIITILLCLKTPQNELTFKNYLVLNYNCIDKEKIKQDVLNISKTDIKKVNIELYPGDIVLANRKNDPNFIDNIIKDRDTTGPYIILYINQEDNLIYAVSGAYSTTNGPKTLFKAEIKNKNILKDNIIHIKATPPVQITKEDIIKRIDTLSKEDLNKLLKKVYSYLYFNPDSNAKVKIKKENYIYYNAPLDVIVYKKGYYLIFDQDTTYFYAYHLYETKKPDLKINDIGYMINLKTISRIPNNKQYEVVKIIPDELLEIVRNKNKWKKCTNLPTLDTINGTMKRGDIISYNNIPYLIFGEYKNYFQIYKLYNQTALNKLCDISTSTIKYKTDFETYFISKTTTCNIKAHMSDDALDKLNNKRKLIKKTIHMSYYPIDYTEEKTTSLNHDQLSLLNKLKEFNFTQEQLIGTLLACNNKFIINELLDIISKKEKSPSFDKVALIHQILKLIRN